MPHDTIPTYYRQLATQCDRAWRHFWLEPRSPTSMSPIRVVVGCFSGCYYLLFTSDLIHWFGPMGLWPRQLAALVATNFGTARSYRFSLLQLSDHPVFLWVVAGVGIVNSVVLIWRLLGRYTYLAAIVNTLLLLSFVHRAAMLTGAFEAILVVLALYVCICPGECCGSTISNAFRTGLPLTGRATIRANIAKRLVQIHLTVAYLVGGSTMLANDVWWEGTAVWWLVTLSPPQPIDLLHLFLYPTGLYLVNVLTHAIVLFHFAFPVLVWCLPVRRLMVHIATFIWPLIALLSGQWAYGLLMACASRAAWLDQWVTHPAESECFHR